MVSQTLNARLAFPAFLSIIPVWTTTGSEGFAVATSSKMDRFWIIRNDILVVRPGYS